MATVGRHGSCRGVPVAAVGGPPLAAGPGGHTQRLLTVKSGSIQDVKAAAGQGARVAAPAGHRVRGRPGVHGLPADLPWLVNAPLLELANVNQTPNPSKAPWYFLGLQELLTMFHPMVAGVTIPGMGIFILILAPWTRTRRTSRGPQVAVSLMTLFPRSGR